MLGKLDRFGFRAAMEYEKRIRAAGRVDFDDLLRLGLLVLEHPGVVSLYRQRFALVVVDEVQDLSIGVRPRCTYWAGPCAMGR